MYVCVNSFNQFHVIGHLDCFRYFATFNGVASNNTFTATSFNNSLVFSYDVLPKIVLLGVCMLCQDQQCLPPNSCLLRTSECDLI